MGLCYTQIITIFVRRFLLACTKPKSSSYPTRGPRTAHSTKLFPEKARRKINKELQNGMDIISEFFEEQAKERSSGVFISIERNFKIQMRMCDFVGDLTWRAPLSSLHCEVIVPMLTGKFLIVYTIYENFHSPVCVFSPS